MMRLIDHLTATLKQHLAGRRPQVPEAGKLIWSLFAEIAATRTYHSNGPHPISYAEIEAFCRLKRWPLRAHHVEIIMALDRVWLDHAYAKITSKSPDPSARRNQKLNPQLFDAMFK